MKRTMIAIAMLAALASAPAQAGPLEDQLELLKKELLQLQQEVAVLRAVLARDATGNVTLKAAGDRGDQVGGDFSTTVGKSGVTRFGGFRSTEIAKDDALKVTGSVNVTAARSIVLEAGDQLLLKVGSASMLMQKSGEITITGSAISIKGSGDVVIKGSRILQN